MWFLLVWVAVAGAIAYIGKKAHNDVLLAVGAVMVLMTCLFD